MAPVPKARPGSITTAIASASGSSHGGPTHSGPIRTGRWNARQRSSHPSSTSSDRAPPNAAQSRSSPAGSVVGGELDAAVVVDLLEPLRKELDHDRARAFGLGRRHRDRHASQGQRNALFSLSKNPRLRPTCRSPRRHAARTPRAAAAARRSAASAPPRSQQPKVAVAPSLEHRHPASTQNTHLPGCVPGSKSSSSSPSSVGTATLPPPSAAWVIVRSTVANRSLPSRTKRGSGLTRTNTYRSPAWRRGHPHGPRRRSGSAGRRGCRAAPRR